MTKLFKISETLFNVIHILPKTQAVHFEFLF